MSKFGKLIHETLNSPRSSQLHVFAEVLREKAEYKRTILTPKMWRLPDGTIQPLGGNLHDEWLKANPQVAARFGLTAKDLAGDHQGVRIAALKKGFIRIAYELRTGHLVVESLYKFYTGQARTDVFMLVADNVEKIDRITISLLDDSATKLLTSRSENLFNFDDKEKLNHIPECSETMRFRYTVHLMG